MRVGLLIYGSLDSISGGYLYDRKLVAYLLAQGDQVETVSLLWRNYTRHLLDNFSRDLLKKLRNLSVDVLIQDELNHPSLAWLNSRLQVSFPIISLVHHLRSEETYPKWQTFLYHQIERRYLKSVDGFIFNSQTTQQSVDHVSAMDHRPWVIATPAGDRFNPQISPDEIIQRAHQQGPLRLIFLGNLIPRKGLHILIEALARLPQDHHTLDVIGGLEANHAYTQQVVAQVKRLELRESVKFHGTLDDSEVAKLLERGQILVVPSSYEGFGIVYLEGMGFGLPCIGTIRGAASEIIVPGKTGYLVNPNDSSGLADELENLYQDRRKLATLSLAARQRYLAFPEWQQSMAQVRAFLHKIIQ